jgi:hypothetical protein
MGPSSQHARIIFEEFVLKNPMRWCDVLSGIRNILVEASL